jgi:hypothetical protein
MNKWFRLIIGFITLLMIFGLWVRFRLKTPNVIFETDNNPIVAVNYFTQYLSDNDPINIEKERDTHILNSAKILLNYKPGIKKFNISSVPGLINCSDFSLFWASDLEHFMPDIVITDLRDRQAQNLASIFSDKDAQRFVQLNSEQEYDLYISFSSAVSEKPGVIIDNNYFPLSRVDDGYYKLTDFTAEHQFLSIKPAEQGQLIDQVVFVTGRIKSVNPVTRIDQFGGDVLEIVRQKIQINIPDSSYLFLKSPATLYLISDQFDKTQDVSGIYFLGDNSERKLHPTISIDTPLAFNIVTHSGLFSSIDSTVQARKAKYFYLSMILLVVGLFFIFMPAIIHFLHKYFGIGKIYYQWLQTRINSNPSEFLFYLFILILLLILKINYQLNFLTAPLFLVVIIFMFVVYARFSMKFVTLVILLITAIIVFFCQNANASLQKNLEYIIFFLLLIAAVKIIFIAGQEKESRSKMSKEGKHEKERKN